MQDLDIERSETQGLITLQREIGRRRAGDLHSEQPGGTGRLPRDRLVRRVKAQLRASALHHFRNVRKMVEVPVRQQHHLDTDAGRQIVQDRRSADSRVNDGGNGRGRVNQRVAVVRHRAADAGDDLRFGHGHSNT